MKLLKRGKTVGMIVCFVLVMIAMGALPVSSSGQRSEYEDDTYRPEEPRDGFVDEPERVPETYQKGAFPMDPEEVAFRLAVFVKEFIDERGVEEVIELVRRSDEENRASELAEAERLLSDSRALEKEADELGVEPWELEEIISGYLEETPEELTPDFGPEEEWIRWMAEAPVGEMILDFCGPSSSTLKTTLVSFEDKYGIEFYFVGNYLCCDWWNNQKKLLNHPDLPEVLAQISKYPGYILKYLGKEEGLEVYLYQAGADAGCYGTAEACYSSVWEVVRIEEGRAAATVHEVAHAIEHLMIDSNQWWYDWDVNPLWGTQKVEEFQGAFGIPGPWKGKVTKDMFHKDPPDPLPSELKNGPPSGFLDTYSMINKGENFAVACGTYAAEDEVGSFITQAEEELWEENASLCLQYRFIYEHIFNGPPQCASKPKLYEPPINGFASFSLQSDTNGDGWVEPGESFTVKVTFVLTSKYWPVTCLPRSPSELISTPKGAYYTPVGKVMTDTWEFTLPASFKGEKNQIFDLVIYYGGKEYVIDSWEMPLHEQGYIWAFNDDKGFFLKLASTLRPVEKIEPPAAVLNAAWPADPVQKTVCFDPALDRFWLAQDDGTIGFIYRWVPTVFAPAPLSPAGMPDPTDDSTTITHIARNPHDGALWAKDVDWSGALRIVPSSVKSGYYLLGPKMESEYIDISFDFDYIDFNPKTGDVWLADNWGEVRCLSASGKTVKCSVKDAALKGITCIAPAAYGECWAGGKQKLLKISKAGKLTELDGIFKMYHYLSMRTHPIDGSLWAVAFIEQPDGSKPEYLLRVSAKGVLLSVWPLSVGGAEGIIPSTTDTSVFVHSVWEVERYHPQKTYPIFAYELPDDGSYHFSISDYLVNYTTTPLDIYLNPDTVDGAIDPKYYGHFLPKEFEYMFP